MVRIEPQPWSEMLAHAVRTYPEECCGAMLGRADTAGKVVTRAVPLKNSYDGSQAARYRIAPEDLLGAERLARRDGLSVIGVYHSHPDHDACFSETDLENSCPWYSFVVLSLRDGRFDHARCWRPDAGRTRAESEPLELCGPETQESN